MSVKKITPEQKLENLKEGMHEQEAILRDIRDRYNEQREKCIIPKLHKKYAGKYFKYKNSCSGGSPSWPIYTHVTAIVSEHEFKGCIFESPPEDSYPRSEYVLSSIIRGEHLFELEISPQEYNKAKKKFLKSITSVLA